MDAPRQQAQIVNALPVRNSQAEALMLRLAEREVMKFKSNSQWVKAWIIFYRFCLKDPLAFAIVK
jgi:hypothetical protein